MRCGDQESVARIRQRSNKPDLALLETFSNGIISGLREIDGVRYIRISAPTSPGNSGGPVILGDGTVIGIATMGAKVGQNLNFAIAAVEAIAAGFFDPARPKSQPPKGQ